MSMGYKGKGEGWRSPGDILRVWGAGNMTSQREKGYRMCLLYYLSREEEEL